MQYHNIPGHFRNFCITLLATVFCLAASSPQAAQYNFTDPVNSNGNNFTMLAIDGSTIGGTNDVVFTWDGTLNDDVSDAISNATLASDQPFFFNLWNAHDVVLYGPGTYTIYDDCAPGNPACGVGNAVTFTVGPEQIGTHMLFDWNVTSDIDVILVWNFVFDWETQNPANPFYDGPDNGITCTPDPPCVPNGLPNTSTTVFSFISTDVNSDGIAGYPMTDGPFSGSQANFNLNGVTFPNTPPVATNFKTSAVTNTATVIDLAARAYDTDGTLNPASVAVVPASGPTNGAVVNNGDGTVTYTSAAAYTGPDSFRYTIDDNLGDTSNEATVTITVLAVANSAPVANDVEFTTPEDVPLNIAVTDLDDLGTPVSTDAEGDPLAFENIYEISTLGSAVIGVPNTITTYTPPGEFSGVDTFDFVTNDGPNDSNIATVTVTVTPVNDGPQCTDVSLASDIDTPLPIDVADDLLSTCTDIEGDAITLESFTQPMQAGSMVVDNGDGSLTYTPAANFQGQDSFTYTATDGTDTDTKTVTIDVGKIFGNFTMLDAGGSTFGGTNDVAASWDGSLNMASTDTNFNMDMGSFSNWKFFGFPWHAHDIRVFGQGSYQFDTSCTSAQLQSGLDNCGGTPDEFLALNVPAGMIGAHMLFDWNVTSDIDVVLLWEMNGSFDNPPPGALFQGETGPTPPLDCKYEYVSRDADGDGVPGARMIDGPFIGFRANFNLNLTRGCGGGSSTTTVSSVTKPSLGGGCTIDPVARIPGRGDLWILLGFIAWLGVVVNGRRRSRQV